MAQPTTQPPKEKPAAAAQPKPAPKPAPKSAQPVIGPNKHGRKASPYEDSVWENIGEFEAQEGFVPLELTVVEGEPSDSDGMFTDFSEGQTVTSGSAHGGGVATQRKKRALTPREQAAVEDACQEYFDAGVAEGKKASDEQVKAREKDRVVKMERFQASLNEALELAIARIEKDALALALEVARRIVAATVEVRPEYIIEVLHEAMGSMGAARPVRVRVSPDDHEFISVIGLPPELSAGELGITYVSDESIRSGCVVETNFGEVDLVLDRVWERIKSQIFQAI